MERYWRVFLSQNFFLFPMVTLFSAISSPSFCQIFKNRVWPLLRDFKLYNQEISLSLLLVTIVLHVNLFMFFLDMSFISQWSVSNILINLRVQLHETSEMTLWMTSLKKMLFPSGYLHTASHRSLLLPWNCWLFVSSLLISISCWQEVFR